ncbi:hypothetical protein KAR34_02495, partial [bacterium]|nr:hypothetical protein [bacterium]
MVKNVRNFLSAGLGPIIMVLVFIVINGSARAATLDHFHIEPISSTTAGSNIVLNITAYDAVGNTVTSVPGTTFLQVVENGTTHLSDANQAWALSPVMSSAQFDGDGKYSGDLNIRKAGMNYVIWIINTTISDNDSNSFNISASTAMRYVVMMPGQTYTPGERFSGVWGRSGTPHPQQAGVAFNVSVVATDGFGNLVNRAETLTVWNGTTPSHLVVSDAGASVAPNPIVLAGGQAYPAIILIEATTAQDLGVTGSLGGVTSSGAFTVYHTVVDHFAISTTSAQVAGSTYTTNITAQDIYYNPVTTYAGTVYVTCPELDYVANTESVLRIPTGTPGYTGSSVTAFWSISGFTAGMVSFSTTIYRATTTSIPAATLFVSDNQNDTPSGYTGYVGQTPGITVSPDSSSNMFAVVPGLEWRPGGIDSSGTGSFAGNGYEGAPLSQKAGTPFSLTVYATDTYWNLINYSTDQFMTTTSPNSSSIHNQIYTLNSGIKQINATFTTDANYTITVDNSNVGITDYITPYTIISSSIDHFEVLPNPMQALWTAGVPQWVTITAYEDVATVATTFNGSAELECTLDHDLSFQVISPQSIAFTNGVWKGNVTIYRANRHAVENNNFSIRFGSVVDSSLPFRIQPNTADKLLILESGGMSHYPGITPDIDPADEFGVQGQPMVQTAGSAIAKLEFMLCDSYGNIADQAPEANGLITIECSDPYPAVISGEGGFVGGSIDVNLTDGVYTANNTFTMYTVNSTAGHSIRVSNSYGHTPYELGVDKNRVPIKHAEPGEGFNVIVDPAIISSSATAGVPFAVTVVAIDAYGNTLDSLNGASPFPAYSSVALSAQTDGGGNASIWPIALGTLETTRWQEGISYAWVYCYKRVSGSQFLTTNYDFGSGNRSGTSQTFSVDYNSYARVVPIVTGMSTPDSVGAGGTYVYSSTYSASPPPAFAAVFNNFGTPNLHTAGDTVSLQAYTCDIYGNTVRYPDVTITMDSSDIYAPDAPDVAAVPTNGFADLSG